MKKSLRYILYSMVCMVSLIIALIFFWWFTSKPYTREAFATPMPYIIMIGLTSTGDVYYADVDVPMSPKWIKTLSGIGDIAGAYGRLYTVTNTAGGSVPKYGSYDSVTQTAMAGGAVTKIAVDEAYSVAGLSGTSYKYSSTGSGSLSTVPGGMVSISMSAGQGYWVGTDHKLQYTASPSTNAFVNTNPSANWSQVSFDGIVCALDTTGTLWYADSNVRNANAKWIQAGSKKFSSICVKSERLLGIGMDGILYYSNTYASPSWTVVPTQPYTANGATSGAPVSFTKAILMYPRPDARRKRFLAGASSCNANEEMIGNYCYQACPSSRPAKGILCPYKARYVNAIASCPDGKDFINNGCYDQCPSGYTIDPQNPEMCKGRDTPKASLSAGSVKAATYTCPSDGTYPGYVEGRYVRVRPTNLIPNNKLCISGITVTDNMGAVISGGTATATDGTNISCPLGSCGIGLSYISGSKYDGDTDGGTANRSTKLYWDLDLGSVKKIHSVAFTGCNYISPNVATTTVATGTGSADQITGMKIEILHTANTPTTEPVTSRSLGLAKTQTVTFAFTRPVDDRCYDVCPPINGVPSVDGGEHTCVAASGGLTSRSVTVPIDLGPATYGPPTDAAGSSMSLPAVNLRGSAMRISNWVQDPSDPSYVLSCDDLPGSVMKPFVTTFNAPVPNTRSSSRNPYNRDGGVASDNPSEVLPGGIGLLTSEDFLPGLFKGADDKLKSCRGLDGTSLNTSDCIRPVGITWAGSGYTNTNMVCILDSAVTCSTPDEMVYIPGQNTCVLRKNRENGDSITKPFVVRHARNCANVYRNRTTVRDIHMDLTGTCWCDGAMCASSGQMNLNNDSQQSHFDHFNPLWTEDLNAYDTYLSLNMAYKIYSNPNVIEGVSIARPRRIKAQPKCVTSDGMPNRQSFIYNNRCMKCPSSTDVFYVRGISQNLSWTTVQQGYLSTYPTSVGAMTFTSFDDAKNMCETTSDCNGITKFNGTTGGSRMVDGTYTLRSGTAIAPSATGETSWKLTRGTAATIGHGDYKGQAFSSEQIPRAFADDYTSTTPISSSGKPANPSSIAALSSMYSSATDAINYLMTTLGAANAAKMYEQIMERQNVYYSINGMERRLAASFTATSGGSTTGSRVPETGICVGPCDSQHPLHDPIQLYKTSGTNPLYVLYGTTCHDSTETIIDTPSIPAIYTPQLGQACPDQPQNVGPSIAYELRGGSCVQECPYGTEDTGTSCVTTSIPRRSFVAKYSCPSNLKLVDSVCLYGCESGDVLNGEYCEPPAVILTLPSTIKCTKTAYGYSSSQGSGVSKWLCDSQEDLNALVAGASGSGGKSSYVQDNDIVCAADDPTTGMYYCQSVEDAVNQVQDSERDDMQATCDNLVKAYNDLSNNLNILSTASTSAKNASAKVATIQVTLKSVYNSMCPTTAGSSAFCTSLNTQLNALNTNINAGSSATTSVLTPIQAAIASRDNLVAQMNKFQCSY